VSRVNFAKCFSVLADETTNISTAALFSHCVHYVDEIAIKICEQFLQFVSVSNTLGQELAGKLIESLKSF
jgi:hypothetical protein